MADAPSKTAIVGTTGVVSTSVRWKDLFIGESGTYTVCYCTQQCTIVSNFASTVATFSVVGPSSVSFFAGDGTTPLTGEAIAGEPFALQVNAESGGLTTDDQIRIVDSTMVCGAMYDGPEEGVGANYKHQGVPGPTRRRMGMGRRSFANPASPRFNGRCRHQPAVEWNVAPGGRLPLVLLRAPASQNIWKNRLFLSRGF